METLMKCPDCDSVIEEGNELIEEIYNPESFGACLNCYDPTPDGGPRGCQSGNKPDCTCDVCY